MLRKKAKIKLVLIVLLLSPSTILFAETTVPQVVVTAHKEERPLADIASSTTVITRDEIEGQNATTVQEVLRNVAGVNIISAGSLGDDVDIRLRGADRDEVLILIDGVPVNNVQEHRASFLGILTLENVERIEVVRGSQGVLYGSDAIGGVINIITRKRAAEPEVALSFEGGNLETFREGVSTVGTIGPNSWSGSFYRTDQRGRFPNDRFGEFATSANYIHDFSPELKLEVGANYFRTDQELFYEFQTGFDPEQGVLLVKIDPDNDNHFHKDLVTSHLSLQAVPAAWWRTELFYGFFADLEDVTNSDAGDVADPGFFPGVQDFTGTGLQNNIDFRNFFPLYETSGFATQLTVGFEFQDERFRFTDGPVVFPDEGQEGDRQNYAPYVEQTFRFLEDRLILTGGARFDHNTTFGDEWSPAGSVLYKIVDSQTRLHFRYGEGFHAPTILEFFDQILLQATGDPSFNPIRLQEELSQSYEAGIEQAFGNWIDLSATFFYIDYDRLFDGLQFMNDAFTTGGEFGVTVRPVSFLTFGGNYTFLRAFNEDTNERLVDRPEHQGNIFVSTNPIDRLSLRADVNIVGSRSIPNVISTSSGDLGVIFIDSEGRTSEGNNLAAYVKVDLSGSYEIFRNRGDLNRWRIYAKIENILDDSYEEKFGFPAPGITFLAGTQASF